MDRLSYGLNLSLKHTASRWIGHHEPRGCWPNGGFEGFEIDIFSDQPSLRLTKLAEDDLTGGQGGLMPDLGGGIEEVAIEPEPDDGALAGPRGEELAMCV